MPPRRVIRLASIVLHAAAIAAVVVAQLVAIGPLPVVHRPLSFDTVSLVAAKDIDLPPRPVSVAPSSATVVSANAAPIVAPDRITPETGLENAAPTVSARGSVAGVEASGSPLEGALPGAGVPPPPPPPPIRLHQGMQPPVKTVDAAPVYPAIARTTRVEGVVILEAVIDETGKVQSVRVLRSIPLLDQAALDAVRQWRFTPTRLNGVAAPIVMTVTVNFTLR